MSRRTVASQYTTRLLETKSALADSKAKSGAVVNHFSNTRKPVRGLLSLSWIPQTWPVRTQGNTNRIPMQIDVHVLVLPSMHARTHTASLSIWIDDSTRHANTLQLNKGHGSLARIRLKCDLILAGWKSGRSSPSKKAITMMSFPMCRFLSSY